MRRLSALLIAVWLGMHIGFGYIAAPALFKQLGALEQSGVLANSKIVAGSLAGSLFHVVNLLGLVAWAAVWLVSRQDNRRSYRKSHTPKWAALLFVLTAVNEFLMTPVINALRQGQSNWLHDWVGGRFGLWHGSSALIYLAAALVGTVLCIRLLRLDGPEH